MVSNVLFLFGEDRDADARKETVREIKYYMKNALGPVEFRRLKELFFHVYIEKYPFKLLVTRRAYLLYKLFVDIFTFFPEELTAFEKPFETYGKIYNSHSMHLLKKYFQDDSIQDKRLLIVDDIIVHGRAVSQTCSDLNNEVFAKIEDMSFWCYYLSYDAKCISPDVKRKLDIYKVTGNQTWKRVSNIFTKAIIDYGVGYTSYIDTYLIRNYDGKILEFLEKKATKQYKVIQTESDSQENYTVKSYIYMKNEALDEDLKCAECLRFYTKGNDLLVIPYLFVDSICATQAYSYIIALLNKYGISKIPCEFDSTIENDIDLVVLFLKWTVNRIGQEIVRQFFNHLTDVADISLEVNQHTESFNLTEDEDMIDIPNSKVDSLKTCVCTEQMNFCAGIFEQAVDQIVPDVGGKLFPDYKTLYDIYTQYSFKIKEEDEANAESGKSDRCTGIRLIDAYDILVKKYKIDGDENKREVLHNLISLFIMQWDTGGASYNLFKIKNAEYTFISGLMRNGEQVYRQIYHLYPHIYPYFKYFTKTTLEYRKSELKRFGNYLKSVWRDKERKGSLFGEEASANKEINDFIQCLEFVSSYFDDVFVVRANKLNESAVNIVKDYIYNYYKN